VDISEFEGDERDAAFIRRLAGRLHEVIGQFNSVKTPVLGGVDGVAAGAGFALATPRPTGPQRRGTTGVRLSSNWAHGGWWGAILAPATRRIPDDEGDRAS
jgi:hypothetical protein